MAIGSEANSDKPAGQEKKSDANQDRKQGLAAHIRQLDLKPNSVLFVNAERVSVEAMTRLRLPYVGFTVPIVFTIGPPEVTLLTRDELKRALHALDNDQPTKGNLST